LFVAMGEGQDASIGEPLQALANRPTAVLSETPRRGANRTPEKRSGGGASLVRTGLQYKFPVSAKNTGNFLGFGRKLPAPYFP
jgi:hypothetical protein